MKATLYIRGGFGVSKEKITLKSCSMDRGTIEVEYIPFRGKTTRRIRKAKYDAYYLILEGWTNPEPPPEMVETDFGMSSKYGCFDKQYLREFDEMMDPRIELGSVKVVRDWRFVTKGGDHA